MDAITQLKISAATLLPKGESLSNLLGPDLARRAAAYVESRERDMDLFDRFTIWAFMMHLTLLDDYEKFLSGVPMDYSFYTQAVADGKEAAGLETLDEIRSRIGRIASKVGVERLWVAPDAGLRALSDEQARRKLGAMIEAAQAF